MLNLRPIEGHSYPRIPGERAYPFRVTSIHLLFLNELDDNRHRQIEPSHCLENFLDEFNTSRESVFAYYWKSSPPPEKVSFFPTKKKLARAPLFILGSCFIVVPQRSLAGSIRSVHHKVLSFPPLQLHSVLMYFAQIAFIPRANKLFELFEIQFEREKRRSHKQN